MANYVCLNCGSVCDEKLRFCPSCNSYDSYIAAAIRPTETILEDSEIVTGAEIRFRSQRSLELRHYSWLQLPRIFSLMVYGSPGSGKTSFLLNLGQDLGVHGKVLFNSLEMGLGESFGNLLSYNEITSGSLDFCCINSFGTLCDKLFSYDFLIIDSLTLSFLLPTDIARIMREYKIAVSFSVHETKSGNYKGDSGLGHYCDILLRTTDNFKVKVEKNRYGIAGVEYAI